MVATGSTVPPIVSLIPKIAFEAIIRHPVKDTGTYLDFVLALELEQFLPVRRCNLRYKTLGFGFYNGSGLHALTTDPSTVVTTTGYLVLAVPLAGFRVLGFNRRDKFAPVEAPPEALNGLKIG